jgi:hypothetical protein
MLVVRALKIGQMIRQLPDGMSPTYDSMHETAALYLSPAAAITP